MGSSAVSLVSAMNSSLSHRGPDDAGLEEVTESVVFGFRRLAILDTSPTGHQPMFSQCKQFCIVFNGEVYNYLELRQGLEAKNYVFRGNSDTEVVLNLYIEYGTDMLKMLNGMFAFAICDLRKA